MDLETGIKEHIGRKGCYLVNSIVAIGMKEVNKSAFVSLDYSQLYWRLASSCGIGILVGHNIKFDLLHLWKDEALQMFLRNGGRIWCTQLAEFMLTGQRHKYPALRDIAVNKYGCPEREKKMEAYWDQGIDTTDIPEELVLEDVKYDVLDTEAIMLKQVAAAKKIGMYDIIMEQMEALLATTEMEYNGVYVNQDILNANKGQIQIDIVETNNKLAKLAPNVDNFASPQQLSRLFFGGNEKVIVNEPILNELGMPILTKTGPNRGQVKTKKITKLVYDMGLGLKPLDNWKQKKEGIYKTDESVLQIISQRLETIAGQIAELMLKSRGLGKLLGTYYEGTAKYIHSEDSSVHSQLCHCGYEDRSGVKGGTGTGRLSSTKPNMQNQSG